MSRRLTVAEAGETPRRRSVRLALVSSVKDQKSPVNSPPSKSSSSELLDFDNTRRRSIENTMEGDGEQIDAPTEGSSDPSTPTKKSGGGSLSQVDKSSAYEVWMTETLCKPILRRIPRSVRPNQITLFNVVVGLFLVYLSANIARWTDHNPPVMLAGYFLTGFLVYVCMILDCLDGMHARATGQCSQLGEVLDHMFDSANIQIMAVALVFVVRSDLMTVGIVVLFSSAVYHGQLLLYRKEHVMVEAPTNGPEAQSMVAAAHVLLGVTFYMLGIDSRMTTYIQVVTAIFGNVIQINNTFFYCKFLRERGVLRAHLVYLATFSLYVGLLWMGLLSVLEFAALSIVIPFRVTGSLVLYSVVEKYHKIDSSRTKFLESTDWFLISWAGSLFVARTFGNVLLSAQVAFVIDLLPWAMIFIICCRMFGHFMYCLQFLDAKKIE